MGEGAGRLQVLGTPGQDCGRCRAVKTCWKPVLTDRQKAINLLVCRIQRGINRDRSTRTLLEMVRRKLGWLATHVANDQAGDQNSIFVDLQSVMIEHLITDYRMGSPIHPLHWLFGEGGTVTRWAKNYRARAQREGRRLVRYGSDNGYDEVERLVHLNRFVTHGRIQSPPPGLAVTPVEYDDTAELNRLRDGAIDIVNDGVTLTLDEYRVLSFCLANARDDRAAPIQTVHAQLAQLIGIPPKAVTALYGAACRRVLEALGLAERCLRTRGLRIPKTARARRRNWRLHLLDQAPMTPEEVHEVLALRKHATAADIAWAYGVSVDLVYRLTRKFKGLTVEEIRAVRNRES